MLASFRKFSEVDGKEWSIYQAVDQMIDEFAENQHCGVGLAKERVKTREDLLAPGCPDVEFLSDFGKI